MLISLLSIILHIAPNNLLPKIKEEFQYDATPDYLPQELPLEESEDPLLLEQQHAVFGKESNLLQREAIQEEYRSQETYREVRHRMEKNIQAGRQDPVFENFQQLNSFELLSNTYLHYAKKMVHPEAQFANSKNIATQLLTQVRRMQAFALGFGIGLTHAAINTVTGTFEVLTLSAKALLDPVQIYDLITEIVETFDGERFTSQVISFLNEQWGLFCDGDEEVKGEMLGQFVGEVILAAFLPAKTLKGLPGIAPQMKIGRLLNSIAKQGKNLSDNVAKLFYNVTEIVGKRPSVVLEVMNSVGKIFTKRKGLSQGNLGKTIASANKLKGGVTNITKQLDKHWNRFGEQSQNIWGKVSGSPAKKHEAAMKHFEDIYKGPGNFNIVKDTKTGVEWIEKRLPDGRGIRLQKDFEFKGFVDGISGNPVEIIRKL